MPEQQARAVTEGIDEAMRGAIATRADVEKLGERLDTKIDAVEQRLDAKIDALAERIESRLAHSDESVARRIAESQATQLRWFVASMFGGLGLLFAALKLIP